MPSTVIRFYRYDAKKRALDIVFQTKKRYTYEQVPEEIYKAMNAATSKGEFFNRHIRDKFPFVRH